MNIFKFEFKKHFVSFLIWSTSIFLGLLIFMAFFPSISSEAQAFADLMDSFPEEFLAIVGMNTELPVSEMSGYFGLTYSFILIPIAIQASIYGFSMLSVEERELTADFLMTKPVTRGKILASKFMANWSILLLTAAVVWGGAIVQIHLFKADVVVNYRDLNLLLSTIPLFQLVFVSVGMLISQCLKRIENVLPYALGLGFGTFILGSFKTLLSNDIFGYFSPYSYFDYNYILVEGEVANWGLITALIIITVSISATYFLYLKRNIASL